MSFPYFPKLLKPAASESRGLRLSNKTTTLLLSSRRNKMIKLKITPAQILEELSTLPHATCQKERD